MQLIMGRSCSEVWFGTFRAFPSIFDGCFVFSTENGVYKRSSNKKCEWWTRTAASLTQNVFVVACCWDNCNKMMKNQEKMLKTDTLPFLTIQMMKMNKYDQPKCTMDTWRSIVGIVKLQCVPHRVFIIWMVKNGKMSVFIIFSSFFVILLHLSQQHATANTFCIKLDAVLVSG